MERVANVASYPMDLSEGTLGVGETTEVEVTPDIQRKIDAGLLAVQKDSKPQESQTASSKANGESK
jgi:hypothetical protein